MRTQSFLAVVLVMAVTTVASADTIRGINMDFVTIGNAGNAGDTRTGTDEYGNPLAIRTAVVQLVIITISASTRLPLLNGRQ